MKLAHNAVFESAEPFAPKVLVAAHVLRAMARAQSEGHRLDLESLCEEIGVRRGDVRAVLSSLHREGFVDVLRMQLTLRGFALGRSLGKRRLAAIRRPGLAAASAA